MGYSIWQINDKEGNKLGLLKTESFLDIIDVVLRAKNQYGKESDYNVLCMVRCGLQRNNV